MNPKLAAGIFLGVITLAIVGQTISTFSTYGAAPGTVYVKKVTSQATGQTIYRQTEFRDRNQPDVQPSLPRTLGVWVAGIMTLCVLSFLYGDNPFYKLAESLVVGTTAAYVMVTAFWSDLVPGLLGKLVPDLVQAWLLPNYKLSTDAYSFVFLPGWRFDPWAFLPLGLAVMMLWRLAPKGKWIARWPLAFFIGTYAGIRLVSEFQSNVVEQVKNTMLPLLVWTNGSLDLRKSFDHLIIITGVISAITYFFFSVEQKGIVGKVARYGIWILMITFGFGFGSTVMGRIVLISQRFEFLLDDWLWLIDINGIRG